MRKGCSLAGAGNETFECNHIAAQAYRRLALEHHPDKGGDKDTFIAVNAANEVLGDESIRRDYDDNRSGYVAHTGNMYRIIYHYHVTVCAWQCHK